MTEKIFGLVRKKRFLIIIVVVNLTPELPTSGLAEKTDANKKVTKIKKCVLLFFGRNNQCQTIIPRIQTQLCEINKTSNVGHKMY